MEIDIEFLITLVEARPVLWDKTVVEYKDKNETQKSWREVCGLLKNDFEIISDKEKDGFCKDVIKRWGNIRDSFKKSCKKLNKNTKSGAGASNIKKYVFNDQLQFLNKMLKERQTQKIEDQATAGDKSENKNKKVDCDIFKKPTKQLESRKRKNVDEVELKILKAIEAEPDRHLSFFKGIAPTLNKFNDDEIVQFQLGVMELITKIKLQKQFSSLPGIPPCLSHQTIHPQSQPACQILHPRSQICVNHTCPWEGRQIFKSTPPSTETTANHFHGEDLLSASSVSIKSSMNDSVDFADENVV